MNGDSNRLMIFNGVRVQNRMEKIKKILNEQRNILNYLNTITEKKTTIIVVF